MTSHRRAVTAVAATIAAGVALPLGVGAAVPGTPSAAAPAALTGPFATALLPPDPVEPRLAFAASTPESSAAPWNFDIHDLVPADGSDLRHLIDSSWGSNGASWLDDTEPAYSADGTQLAWTADAGSEQTQILVTDLTTLEPSDEIPAELPEWAVPLDPDRPSGASDHGATWSPDGDEVAFIREGYLPGTENWVTALMVSNVRWSWQTPRVLLGDAAFRLAEPSWSPDGSQIVVADLESRDLLVVDVATGEPARLFPPLDTDCDGECPALKGRNPDWSVDGTRIVWEDGGRIYQAEMTEKPEDGSWYLADVLPVYPRDDLPDPVPAPDLELDDPWDPTWSPDGTEVVVAAQETVSGEQGIFAVDVSDGSVRGIAQPGGQPMYWEYSSPDYQPVTDLSVELEVQPPLQPARTTDVLEVTVTVMNEGTAPPRDPVVELALPPGVTPLLLPGECRAPVGGVVTCEPWSLAPGDDALEVQLGFRTYGAAEGTHALEARVTSATPEVEVEDNYTTHDLIILPPSVEEPVVRPRLAFTRQEGIELGDNSQNVADVPVDGSAVRMLADAVIIDPAGRLHRPDETEPAYSPDGRRLLFSASPYQLEHEPDGDWYSVSQDRVLVVGHVVDSPSGQPALVNVQPLAYETVAGAVDADPAWSPDGTQIAFGRSERGGGAGTVAVMLVDVETGMTTRIELPDGPQGDPLRAVTPAWSPDGTRLALAASANNEDWFLWIVHLEDEPAPTAYPVLILTPECDTTGADCSFDLVRGSDPAWSPDGTRIAFDTARYWEEVTVLTVEVPPGPDGEAYGVQEPDVVAGPPPGSDDTPGPDGLLGAWAPAWSPDGERLAVVAWSGQQSPAAIYTLPATGGTPEVKVDESTDEVWVDYDDPAYQPWSDVGIELTADPGSVLTGEAIELTATVANHGPSPAWNARVTIRLPGPVEEIATSWPAECTAAGTTLLCPTAGTLAVGGSLTFPVTVVLDEPEIYAAEAGVTVSSVDPVSDNDVAGVRFVVEPREEPTTEEPTTEEPTTEEPTTEEPTTEEPTTEEPTTEEPTTEEPTTEEPTTEEPTTEEPTTEEPTTTPLRPRLVSGDLAVRLELDAERAWVGGDEVTMRIVVTNRGPDTVTDASLTATLPGTVTEPVGGRACLRLPGPCNLGTMPAGAERTLTVRLGPVAEGEDSAEVVVTAETRDPVRSNNRASADLEVLQPTLRLFPAVTFPGDVPLAYGVDFPPGATLQLTWDPGITSRRAPYTVAEDGTLRQPILVLPRDELGTRTLRATAVDGPSFGEVEAPSVLVVPRSSSPPSFVTRG